MSIYLSHLSIQLCIFLFPHVPIDLSIYLSVCLSIYLSTCLSASLKTKLFCETVLNLTTSKTEQFCETSSMFELDNVKNEAILRDFFIFQSWQHQERSNSARLPQFLNLTTSKTKQFCETSSYFKLDNIKNEAILRDFLQKWKVACSADGLVPMRFAIFPLRLSKLLRLRRKSDQVIRSAAPVTQNHLSKPEDLRLQNAPDRLTALMKMSHVLRLPRKMHLCRSCSNVPRLPSFLEMPQNPHVLLTFGKVQNPLRLPRETTSEPPKVVRTPGVLYILTSKCASRHNGVHFFAKVVRTWCALYILTSKCASRHNGVQLVISHLARWLRTRRFSEPTFRPSGATNHLKNTGCFATFLPFRAPASSFFWLFLFSAFLSSTLLSSSTLLFSLTLPISAFSSVHIVGSMASKLPSVIWYDMVRHSVLDWIYIYIYNILQPPGSFKSEISTMHGWCGWQKSRKYSLTKAMEMMHSMERGAVPLSD